MASPCKSSRGGRTYARKETTREEARGAVEAGGEARREEDDRVSGVVDADGRDRRSQADRREARGREGEAGGGEGQARSREGEAGGAEHEGRRDVVPHDDPGREARREGEDGEGEAGGEGQARREEDVVGHGEGRSPARDEQCVACDDRAPRAGELQARFDDDEARGHEAVGREVTRCGSARPGAHGSHRAAAPPARFPRRFLGHTCYT